MNKKLKQYISGLLIGLGSILTGFSAAVLIKLDSIELSKLINQNSSPHAFIVQSGSMEPQIKVGSIVFTLPTDNYLPGDVITYKKDEKGKTLITHRVEFKEYPNGLNANPVYITSGDANNTFDAEKVKSEMVVGKVVLSMPYAGYVANYAKTPVGFIIFVIIPATIVIWEELKNLGREIYVLFKNFGLFIRSKFRKKKVVNISPNQNTVVDKDATDNYLISNLAAIIPLTGAFLVFVALTSSLFRDTESSIGNMFTAGIFETQRLEQTGTLVINEVLPSSSESSGNVECSWVELYNGYANEVNLKDFKIADSANSPIALINAANLILEPGEMALLAHNQSVWIQCESDRNPDVQTGQLGTGDLDFDLNLLRLLDGNENIIDQVEWGGNTGLNPAINESIERDPDGTDTASGASFNANDFLVRPNPQPGY